MISAFALGGAVLDEPRYAEAARRAAEFIIAHLYDRETGVLLRRYRAGDAAIPGFLDDYALFVQALLDLYEAQFDLRHLELAVAPHRKAARALRRPRRRRLLQYRRRTIAHLVLRVKEDYDGAEPSGNSVAVLNLLRLAQMTNRDDLRRVRRPHFRAFAAALQLAPVAIPQMLAACELALGAPARNHPRRRRAIPPLWPPCSANSTRASSPIASCCWPTPETRDKLAEMLPSVAAMQPVRRRRAAPTFAAITPASCRSTNRTELPN